MENFNKSRKCLGKGAALSASDMFRDVDGHFEALLRRFSASCVSVELLLQSLPADVRTKRKPVGWLVGWLKTL